MVKNLNESRKDPERSAAAKARKGPPNPWPELKRLREDTSRLLRERDESNRLCTAARNTAESFKRECDYYRSLSDKQAALSSEQQRLIGLLSQPWWKRDGTAIGAARRAVDICQRAVAGHRMDVPLRGENQPIPAGNISGLRNTRN